MPLNSQGIIQEVRQEFEVLLEYVTGDEAQQAHAAEIERGLLRRLLGLGGRLLLLFFIQRAAAYPRTAQTSAQGEALPYQGQRTRNYFSILGVFAYSRVVITDNRVALTFNKRIPLPERRRRRCRS